MAGEQQRPSVLRRARQVFGVALVSHINYLFWVPDLLVLLWLARVTAWWVPTAAALAWMWWDRGAPDTGTSRRWTFGQLLWLGRDLREYFPVRVVRAAGAVLDAKNNYIMDVHPHGVGFCGLGGAMYCGEFLDADGELNFHIASHPFFFLTPILREVTLRIGLVSAKKRTFQHLLGGPGRGRVLVVYSGALEELGRMREDAVHFYLKRRGFCRVALQEGASLVPAIMLGENRLYRQDFLGVQGWLRRVTGVAVKLPFGRNLTCLPRRSPLIFVVGAPIAVQKTADPSQLQVQQLHDTYVAAIRQLYDEHAPLYSCPPLPLVVET